MAFRLENHEQPLAGLMRLFREEVDGIARELGGFARQPTRAVHEARKHGKRARAVLRLLRHSLPEMCRTENQALRDLGRQLAPLRDQVAKRESFDRLTKKKALPSIRRALARTPVSAEGKDVTPQIARAKEISRRIERVDLPNEAGFAILAKGLTTTYRKARQAMKTAEDFHEWRKRVKDLGYQFQLLRKLWPKILKAFHGELDDLGELLGENQDLTVLENAVEKLSITKGDSKSFRVLVKKRREHLRKECQELGRLLFAEKPKAFACRVSGYWQAVRGD